MDEESVAKRAMRIGAARATAPATVDGAAPYAAEAAEQWPSGRSSSATCLGTVPDPAASVTDPAHGARLSLCSHDAGAVNTHAGGAAGDTIAAPSAAQGSAGDGALDRLKRAAVATAVAAYEWTIADDRLEWSGDVVGALKVAGPEAVSTGRRFAALLDTENLTNRYETVLNSTAVDDGDGVAFEIEYRLFPNGPGIGRGHWIEDRGKWFAGPDGRPERAIGMVRIVDERHERDQKLAYLSCYDPLTGMMNRARLTEALEDAVATAERHGTACCFLLAAVDNLAMVNDAYGFDVADQVIAAVSQRLRRAMRTGDSIGRYAGNKFGMILGNCSEQDLRIAADRLLRVVRETVIETAAGPVSATISMGGVAIPRHARYAAAAMVGAEEALDQAKAKHRDAFIAYEHSQRRESIRKRNIMFADEIVSALNSRRFALAYQPIVRASDGEPVLYECLLRMIKPDNEVIAASHFIPVAEQLGLVRLVDHRVLELAVAVLQEVPWLRLSLNVSAVTATDPDWFSKLAAFMKLHREAAGRLTVEITETAALLDLEESCRFIGRLRELGCRIAIDDFGAGYTSFRNLKSLGVDMVKLDGTFCEQLAQNPDNQVFVRAMLDLARAFGVETVAEWVQDEEDARLLRQWGIDYLQGYLFGTASLDKPWMTGFAERA